VHPDVAALLALQDDDLTIQALEARLNALEPRLRELERRREAAVEALGRAQQQAEAEERRQRELQGRLSDHRQLQERNQAQLNVISRAKEAAAAMAQMDQSRRMVADTEGELQSTTRRVADLHQSVAAQEQAVAQATRERDEARAVVDEERRAIEAELAEARRKREDAARRVPRSTLALYDRVRRRNARAVWPLRNVSCASCDTAVPLQRRNQMTGTGRVELCEVCGVMLYATE
jgi:predicted  nucleic acid-binding Zn-ribbon protein